MDKNTERRNTRRIVSTGVEEEGGALRSVIDILEHGVEVENGSVGIQVAVVLGGNTSIVEDAVVVAPSRLRVLVMFWSTKNWARRRREPEPEMA